MPSSTIGSMSQLFITQRHNLDLRTRLGTLTSEFSSGRKDDLAKSLGTDSARLSNIDRRLDLITSYTRSGTEIGQQLDIVQQALDRLDSVRSPLSESLINAEFVDSSFQREALASQGREAFKEMVGALNSRFANTSLFAGNATNQPALAPADQMIASIEAAVAGLTTVADVEAALDTWFDDPAGGFATTGYLGDTGAPVERRLDESRTLTLDYRADSDEIRQVLKATAKSFAAMASDLQTSDQISTLKQSGIDLASSAEPLVQFRSAIGTTQARVDGTLASLAAEETVLSGIYNDLTLADPFETGLALQELQTQLETHYTVTARLSRLSLTEYV